MALRSQLCYLLFIGAHCCRIRVPVRYFLELQPVVHVHPIFCVRNGCNRAIYVHLLISTEIRDCSNRCATLIQVLILVVGYALILVGFVLQVILSVQFINFLWSDTAKPWVVRILYPLPRGGRGTRYP